MNDKINSTNTVDVSGDQQDPLDQLFGAARTRAPELYDDNFTKMVINSLPTEPQRNLLSQRANRSGISFDLLGLFIGVLCAYMFVEMRTVLEFVLSFVPESLVISPMLVGAGLVTTILLSVTAWWTVEYGSKA